jgi:S-adenosylmethionine:tRNA ribosyltransferase-isomerase
LLHPKYLSIKDYTYPLPEGRIAKYPLAERDQSKLLLYRNGQITEDVYANLASHLPANSTLIFNNTKVVEARLLFQKANGSTIEIFCLEPDERYPDITTAMLQKSKVWWKCLVGGAKKWKEGSLIHMIRKDSAEIALTARKVEQLRDYFLIEFNWDDADLSFAEILHYTGLIPLPPYINRLVEDSDKERYQTIYAKFDGSVAAPTAGLHFTDALFEKLAARNIHRRFVTLHVGAGTFKPVKASIMQEHEMHAEFIDVDISLIQNLHKQIHNKIIAVGTTSLRTIESLYWLGVKAALHPFTSPDNFLVTQWEPYDSAANNISAVEALTALQNWMNHHRLLRLITKTQIIIAPGYQFRIINGLITNFHQPQSTLLLLVAALIGEDWKKVYQYALEQDFRFLSYGDGAMLWGVNN